MTSARGFHNGCRAVVFWADVKKIPLLGSMISVDVVWTSVHVLSDDVCGTFVVIVTDRPAGVSTSNEDPKFESNREKCMLHKERVGSRRECS